MKILHWCHFLHGFSVHKDIAVMSVTARFHRTQGHYRDDNSCTVTQFTRTLQWCQFLNSYSVHKNIAVMSVSRGFTQHNNIAVMSVPARFYTTQEHCSDVSSRAVSHNTRTLHWCQFLHDFSLHKDTVVMTSPAWFLNTWVHCSNPSICTFSQHNPDM